MSSIKVNADYEAVLFSSKTSLPVINQALEFLAFFIDPRPVITQKKYTDEYLEHVAELVGRKPVLKSEGKFENWWGPLINPTLERTLNSKEMSTKLNLDNKWCDDTYLVTSMNDLPPLGDKVYLAKNPFGMSGQNFSMVSEGRLDKLEVQLKQGSVILEPFFDRVYDFSHFVFPNGINICYQNVIDQKFQYRGTCFQNYTMPTIQNLPFYHEVEKAEWDKFESALKTIIDHYKTPELPCGFSIDSFIYRENNKLKIRFLSEVNYRRTMGQVAFELAMKFGGTRKWSLFLLAKKSELKFSELKEKISPLAWTPDITDGVVLLSPGDVRYDMFFLSARDREEGSKLLSDLKKLLPDSEFTIQI